MKKIIATLILVVTAISSYGQIYLEDIDKGWPTKTISNVANGSIGVLLESFDKTWPTWMGKTIRNTMEKGLSKEVLDEETELTVIVDATNGYASVGDAGTDRDAAEANGTQFYGRGDALKNDGTFPWEENLTGLNAWIASHV